MARSRRSKDSHSPSRLEVVQKDARDRAIFWDRTSISSFLVIIAIIGIIAIIIGSAGLSNGDLKIGHNFQLSYGASRWRYTVICLCMIIFGGNLIMPLPLFLMIKERTAVLICSITMGSNFIIFMYAFIVDVLARNRFDFF